MADDAHLQQARETLERAGATRVRVEIPDMEGSLRGKYTSAAKVLKGKGATLSDVFYVLSVRDDVFESPLTVCCRWNWPATRRSRASRWS